MQNPTFDTDSLQKRIEYRFKEEEHLLRCFRYRENKSTSEHRASYEAIEFLGDAILGAVVAELLLVKYPDEKEGELTLMRSNITSNITLQKIGLALDLPQGVVRRKKVQSTKNLAADLTEALIGAVFLDGGWKAAQSLVEKLFKTELTLIVPGSHLKHPKTLLQEWAQKSESPLPEYQYAGSKSMHNGKIVFGFACLIYKHKQNKLTPEHFIGFGYSRQIAERRAATLACEAIKSQN